MIKDNSSGFGRMNGLVADKTGEIPVYCLDLLFSFLSCASTRVSYNSLARMALLPRNAIDCTQRI